MNKIGSSEIGVVLNGGKDVLDSATIPVEWGLSTELAERNPQFIVIADITTSLEGIKEYGYCRTNKNRSRIFKPTELVGYVPVYRPGKHSFIIFVVYGYNRKDAYTHAEKIRSREYWYERLERGFEGGVSFTTVDFEVPEELFAAKPETKFSKIVWSWSNRFFEKEPTDQCAYRKRRIFAFTLQPFLFLIGRIAIGIFGTLYGIIGSILLFMIGLKPISPKDYLYGSWINLSKFTMNLFKFDWYSWDRNWRLWKKDPEGDWYSSSNSYIPAYFVPIFIPFELSGVALVLTGIYFAVKAVLISLGVGNLFLIIVGIFLVYLLIRLLVPKMIRLFDRIEAWSAKHSEKKVAVQQKKTKDEKVLSLNERRTKERIEFLKLNASLALPSKVDIQTVIKKVDRPTKFRLSFWMTKAKICKPYSS